MIHTRNKQKKTFKSCESGFFLKDNYRLWYPASKISNNLFHALKHK